MPRPRIMAWSWPLVAFGAVAGPAPPAAGQAAFVQLFGVDRMPAVEPLRGRDPPGGTRDFMLHELLQQVLPASPRSPPTKTGLAVPELQTVYSTPFAATACSSESPAPPRVLDARVSKARHMFWPAIAAAECRFGLPSGLMDSVVLVESHYDPTIVSPAGAVGLSQLMPLTALRLGVLDRLDPTANIEAGARYLRELIADFSGNIPLALAAYNAGPAAVRRVGGIPANGETPGYVQRVLSYWTAPGIGPMSPAISARQTAQMFGFGPPKTN